MLTDEQFSQLMTTMRQMNEHNGILGRRLTVERDMVSMLFALAAAHQWNVAEALEKVREQLAKETGGTAHDIALRDEYVARATELLRSAGKKPS